MTIEQRLMKPGQFDLSLKADAPWSKKSAIREFDHIVVMPGPFDPTGFSNANILANAAYVGVVTRCDSKAGTFSGAGLAHWLGTADGMGDILDTAVSYTNGTLTQWVTALCPSSLTVGTVTNLGFGLTYTAQWCTRRQALDDVRNLLGPPENAEWRVNNDFTLDAGTPAHLFRTTPLVVITDKEEGQDGAYRGLDGEMSQQVDATRYGTAAIVVAQGSGSTVATAAATSGATTYRDGLGNVVVMEGLFNAPATASGSAAGAANAALAQISSVARQVSVSSNTYGVTRFAKPGDSVYAFDLAAQLVDITQQITYRGELITPLTERVYAITWPVETGMSVFVRRSTGVGTFTYTDLTDCFEYETGDVTWEVGAVDQSVAPDITSIAQNIDIQGRAAGQQPWTAVTFQNSWTNYGGAYQACQYRAVGDMVQVRGLIAGGTSGTTAFTLPVGFRPPGHIQFAQTSNATAGLATAAVATSGTVAIYAATVGGDVSCNFEFSVTS